MEADFIRWLRQRVASHPRLTVGLGSDAAVIANSAASGWVVTTDAITEGVDFRLAVDSPRRIGRKALAVNLSDLAAMAARPVAVVINLVLPHHGAAALARELYEGLLPLAEQFEVAIAGGDTNTWDGGLVVAITAMGETTPRGAWTRSGARPGDDILVTGSFGGSFLGKQFDFTPRVATALQINERFEIHAATDVSDGLSLDLSHILEESGCGAVLELNRIPLADSAAEWARTCGDGRSALEHALSDGEDFELILTAPPDVAERILESHEALGLNVPVTRIGRCIAELGLFAQQTDGTCRPLVPRGYQHDD